MITQKPLSKLTRWDRNYRAGNIEAIISSIVRFGFRGALRVRGDGTVIAGNQSLIALETMRATGAKPPTCIEVDAEGEWLVPVIVIEDLNQLESQALAIADNRTHDLGEDDPTRLAELLEELRSEEGLMEIAGYSLANLDQLLSLIDEPTIEPAAADSQGKLGEVSSSPICDQCGRELAKKK